MTAKELANKGMGHPLLVDVRTIAAMLGRSVRSVWRDEELGRIPRPITIGRSKRWRLKEVKAWIKAGCPDRMTWERVPWEPDQHRPRE